MSDGVDTPKEPMAAYTDDEIVDTARGIVTGELLVADLRMHEWQVSLALYMGSFPPNTGLVLVPMSAHHSTRWINGVAPGCTFSCRIVPLESLDRLQDEVNRMQAAMYPAKKEKTSDEV